MNRKLRRKIFYFPLPIKTGKIIHQTKTKPQETLEFIQCTHTRTEGERESFSFDIPTTVSGSASQVESKRMLRLIRLEIFGSVLDN